MPRLEFSNRGTYHSLLLNFSLVTLFRTFPASRFVFHGFVNLLAQGFGFSGAFRFATFFFCHGGKAVREQHGQQGFHDVAGAIGLVAIAATNENTRHDIDTGLLDGFGEAVEHRLGDLELRSTIRADLFFSGQGLRDTDAGHLFGFRLGERLDQPWSTLWSQE